MADSVAKRAIRETRDMTRLAVDAAKNELIEELAPAIKEILERKLREGTLAEDVDRLRRAKEGHGETEFEEGAEMKKKDKQDESLDSMFPSISEGYGEEEDMAEGRPAKVGADEMDESGIPTLGEGEDEMDEAADAEMDEDLEISESELEEMYKEALQLEVDVSKGFKDMDVAKDIGGTDPDKAPALSDPNLIAQVKTGDHHWENELPPAKKNWMPENVQNLVRRGIAENKALATENRKLSEMVRKMHSKLTEMNLFNTKILHANRFMTRHRLNTEQKRSVVESLDRAATVQEVKRIYTVLESTFKAVGAVTESARKPRADGQKRRTSAAPNERVLRESVDKAQGGGFVRWNELAGLTNGKS